MEYRETLHQIYRLTDYGRKGIAAYAPEFYNLARMHRLLEQLGHPQQSFQAVHIAGTKGKGSTAALVESVLRAAGYRTGLYTSPHLHTFRERIQAGGELIPETDVVRLFAGMRPWVDATPAITTFEVMTGLALAWFAEQGVEWAVLEVGLGGRLDATNVVTPAVAIITSISYDHTAVLGETLAEIAGEKAGIVKPGVPVVCAPQPDEALKVIEATCRQRGAPLSLVGRDWTWQAGSADLEGQRLSVEGRSQRWPDLWVPLLGEHQGVNAVTALAALVLLAEAGLDLPETAIRAGFRSVRWPGRLEILGRAPFVVADSAHNGDSARKLMAALRTIFGPRRLTLIVGASTDHATPDLFEALLRDADRAIATQAQHPRAADPSWLQARTRELGFSLETSETVPQALDLALAAAGPADLICCTGSVFVAAEARAAWFASQGLPTPPCDPT